MPGTGVADRMTEERCQHDRVSGAGVIAHVHSGKLFPLEKLAAKLGLSQRSLLTARKLDVYGIAIVKRAFPKAFG